MTILVFGKTGQVAKEIARRAPDAVFLGRDLADLSVPVACADAIRAHRPSAVINAAAYTAVDRAEEDEDLATLVNGAAPAAMAEACDKLRIPFVHISTDYVFDGAGSSPFREDQPTGPLGAYGRSKLAGERGIAETGANYAILRTSWVFSAHGSNFVKTMLRLGTERDFLKIVDDQVGGPTPAADIAAACLAIVPQLGAHPSKSGIYHFSGAPDVSWAGFAQAIFQMAGLTPKVEGIPTRDYPTPAARPLNSRLDCAKLQSSFGIMRPDWRQGLADVIEELGIS